MCRRTQQAVNTRGSPIHSSTFHPRRYANAPDAELISACLNGEEAAWDMLLRRYESLVCAVACRTGLSQADTEDVFQDVCVLLLNHLEDLRERSRIAGWLIAVTKREAWRKRRRGGAILEAELAEAEWNLEAATPVLGSEQPLPDAEIQALESQHLVRLALQRLPDRCRSLLTLLYVKDPPLSYAETACRLKLPLGSIGPSRARCLQNLEKILKEMDF